MKRRTFHRRFATLHIFLGFFSTFYGFGFLREVESLGINYGQVADNLPHPEKVLELLQSLKITKARIFDTNPQVLRVFANSKVELIVTVENDMLSTLMDPDQALQWVSSRIRPYFPTTRITGIAVGNEVYAGDGDTTLISQVVPAMINIHSALVQLGLDSYIKVSTPSSLAVLQQSYPPSAGAFTPELNEIMPQLLLFLATTKSPFWINAYPYLLRNKYCLDYLFASSSEVFYY